MDKSTYRNSVVLASLYFTGLNIVFEIFNVSKEDNVPGN